MALVLPRKLGGGPYDLFLRKAGFFESDAPRENVGPRPATPRFLTLESSNPRWRLHSSRRTQDHSAILIVDDSDRRFDLERSLLSKDSQHGSCLGPRRTGRRSWPHVFDWRKDQVRPQDADISHPRSDARPKPGSLPTDWSAR